MWRVLLLCALFMSVNLTDVSYYEILGIGKDASQQMIRQAYKKLAVKLHPDKNPDEEEKFLEITEAYDTLKDPEKRRHYDLYGSQAYMRRYDARSQAEYDNLYYKGLYHEDPYVTTLTGSSYHTYLGEGLYFINFYSPFCPPCQQLADDWKKLAEVYKGVVKVGAVNCKHQNSFCFNTMRIGSYPSLLFYPNGKRGNFLYYRGEHDFESLDRFVLQYVNAYAPVVVISRVLKTSGVHVYVLGANTLPRDALARIAYQLSGLASIFIVEDDDVRAELSKKETTTVVIRHGERVRETDSEDEATILNEIVNVLPPIETIDPEKFKEIRTALRGGAPRPRALHFDFEARPALALHRLRAKYPHIDFGSIPCSQWEQLCHSLQHWTSGWGVLKKHGTYQAASPESDVTEFLSLVTSLDNLHSLSASELLNVLDGGAGPWVVGVVPAGSDNKLLPPFASLAARYRDTEQLQFGILHCSWETEKYCRSIGGSQIAVLVQNGTERDEYKGPLQAEPMGEFLQMLIDELVVDLSEQQLMEISGSWPRDQAWFVAFFPEHCEHSCREHVAQFRLVAHKVRALPQLSIGWVRCGRAGGAGGAWCRSVRAASVRLYSTQQQHPHAASMQQFPEASLLAGWALAFLSAPVVDLDPAAFTTLVLSQDLSTHSNKSPWLVYFHSPRCYHCHEMYPDFAIVAMKLQDSVRSGKMNCLEHRSMCRQEQITSYPSLKLYLPRGQVVKVPVSHHEALFRVIREKSRSYATVTHDEL